MPIEPLTASPEIQRRVSAYPGTLTYMDLMARNRRQSVVLMVALILLGVLIGAAAGLVVGVRITHGGDMPSLLPSVAVGAAVALLAAGLGSVWSWFGGSSAILMLSGARPVTAREDPELLNVVDEMRLAAGLPMPRVYLIDEPAMNAFATGRDPAHAAIAVTTGLRRHLTREELQGVVAHEMAHIRHLDIRFAMLMATMAGLIAFACDGLLRLAWHGGRAMGRGSSSSKGKGGAAAIVLVLVAVVLAILAPTIARLVQLAYSRQREYLADAGAVELTRNPLGLASALAKLADDREPLVDRANRGTAHLFIVNPLRKMRESHQSINSIWFSHPPIRERIARLMALAR